MICESGGSGRSEERKGVDGVEPVEAVEIVESVEGSGSNGSNGRKEGWRKDLGHPEPTGRKVATTMPKRPYPRYRRRHDAILLYILENPMQTQKEIAAATGYSPSQISRILCSPDFRAQYDVRMQEATFVARSKWLTRITSATS